ncbi:MAG: DNA-binding protein [Candidatus Competibacteraceae bacterium]
MARSGIRYEEVKNAAETLLSRGLSPTIQRVREVLGTGSNTTISDHLKHWQQRMAEAPRAILPPAMPPVVMTALEALWKTAVQQAEAAFDEQRTAAEQAVVIAEQARDQAIAEAQQAHHAAVEARNQWETLQITARELADRLLIEQERRTAAEAALITAEQQVQGALATVAQIRTETAARVSEWETALQQLRADMEQQRAEAQQRLEIERQRGELIEARLMQQLDHSRQEQTTERQAFAAERQDWKNQEITAQQQQEALRQENIQWRTRWAAAEGRQEALTNEMGQLRTLHQQAETRHLDAVRNAETLRGELKAAQANQERLQQELAFLTATLHNQTSTAQSDDH